MSLKLKGDFRANTTLLASVLRPESKSINFVLNVKQNLKINCQ